MNKSLIKYIGIRLVLVVFWIIIAVISAQIIGSLWCAKHQYNNVLDLLVILGCLGFKVKVLMWFFVFWIVAILGDTAYMHIKKEYKKRNVNLFFLLILTITCLGWCIYLKITNAPTIFG